MGSESLKLPVIEFSKLKKESERWESTKIQVRQALEDYGCFEATFDDISLHLQKSILEGVEQLFDLPVSIKAGNESERAHHGYIGKTPDYPLYESLGLKDALSPQNIDTFTNLMWPKGNPSFSKNLQSYTKKLSELEKIVRKMVLESLGLGKYVEEHIHSTDYVVRIQKYGSPPKDDSDQPGLIPHTDQNILTILQQLNQVPGLELITKDAQKWFIAKPTSPYSFFVFVGLSFHAWTNGILHSAGHRVTMNGDKDRYTIALFSTLKAGSIIKAPEELVDEDHPLLYKPYDYHKYIDYYFAKAREGTMIALNPLKDYCGA